MSKQPQRNSRIGAIALSSILIALLLMIGRALAIQSPSGNIAVESTGQLPDDRQAAYPVPVLATEPVGLTMGPTVFIIPLPVSLGIVIDTKTSVIIHVEPGSAADKAGIKTEDRLLAWNGTPIGDLSQEQRFYDLKQSIRNAADTSKGSILIERGGKQMDFPVIPSALPFPPPGWNNVDDTPPTATPVMLPYLYL